jgi:hypothetical protein
MVEIGEAAIENRAKALCEENGTDWEAQLHPMTPGAKLLAAISEAVRTEYRVKAKEQLVKEETTRAHFYDMLQKFRNMESSPWPFLCAAAMVEYLAKMAGYGYK